MVGDNTLELKLIPLKPYSINQVVLEVVFKNRATQTSDEVEVASTRVTLTPDTKNSDLVKTLNAYLGGDIVLSLPDWLNDKQFATPVDANDLIGVDDDGNKYYCISNLLFFVSGVYSLIPDPDSTSEDPTYSNTDLLLDNLALTEVVDENTGKVKRGLAACTEWTDLYEAPSKLTFMLHIDPLEESSLSFNQSDIVRSLNCYNDPKYAGCFISELASHVTKKEVKNVDIFQPRTFSQVLSGSEGQRYYTKIDESGSNLLTNMELVDSDVEDPFDITGDKKLYLRTEDGDNYVYTQTAPDEIPEPPADETDPTPVVVYVAKDETQVPPAMEPIDTTAEDSKYEVKVDGENDTYTKTVWVPSSYEIATVTINAGEENAKDVKLYGSFLDTQSADAEAAIAVVRSKMSDDEALYFVRENDVYVLLVLPPEEGSEEGSDEDPNNTIEVTSLVEISSENRRGLHYIIKQIAAIRKDLTCIFTTPYHPEEDVDEEVFDLNKACNWVAARGDYTNLFEYGNSQAIDYSEQAFYCEMYWSWVKWRTVKLVNGLATGSSVVEVPATGFVILNSLASFRAKGAYYPVAGDQGGILPDSCTILQNPSTKSQRDKLISYRINPIFDTGLRGIQIYGNDTLNPQYTDLSAAHIARTLVQIRSQTDRYTETIKFKLNDQFTWGGWINYVSTRILEPIKAGGGLQWYQVNMGLDTTTRAEISQRKIRGMISLQFVQALEIVDLEFVVYSSALDMEAES